MAFRGEGGGSGVPSMGGLGPMAGVVMVFIGLIVVVAIQQFAPTIGGQIEKATPGNYVEICRYNTSTAFGYVLQPCRGSGFDNITTYSKWNTTANTNFPQAADVYSSNAQMGNLLVLIIIVSLILAYLIRI